jgi:hypothetical protein
MEDKNILSVRRSYRLRIPSIFSFLFAGSLDKLPLQHPTLPAYKEAPMNRRNALKLAGTALGTIPFSRLSAADLFEHRTTELDDNVLKQLDRLKGEPVCRCAIRMERGGSI